MIEFEKSNLLITDSFLGEKREEELQSLVKKVEKKAKQANIAQVVYEEYVRKEKQSPDPNDRIIYSIPSGQDQWGFGTRGELLSNGHLMINGVGDGEKLLIAGKVGDRDFSKSSLLNQEDIEYIRSEQYKNSTWHKSVTLPELRKDMLLFLLSSQEPTDFLGGRTGFINHVQVAFQRKYPKKLGSFMDNLMNEYKSSFELQNNLNSLIRPKGWGAWITENYFSDLLPWWPEKEGAIIHRNIRLRKMMVRSYRFENSHSVFLDSGFKLPFSGDVSLNANGLRRLNFYVYDLSAKGISEVGGDNDQIYLTLQEYYDFVFIKDRDRREEVQRQETKYIRKISEYQSPEKVQALIDKGVERLSQLVGCKP